ncbi:Lrp/AsnC family transcription regulator [Natronomonas pharaonis DSM 2160]|uniref:Lrp/AsnC family transcription regulator n=1 Tax=Natronomonas pharaonis (strain ATCC 35678 / DSM 2160 / CIP 103997 / JCM 8858 / NBRC 14720 / NCIMB 2260 / Gabara) TaxID=348780 RepID=A0A1U7EW81_NATPD|nr:Lrp/AsnC ligand binding domain-containing protein [Natronomonas pharaonis]CAI49328.1 Lrp/AsnC family transcription regulator [Natronomonas pharaonis DSM 2160]
MARSFIMVKADTGRARALLERFSDLDYIADANVVAGDIDIVLEAEADEVADIIDSVATNVRAIEGVVDTKTYVCLE